MNVTFVGTTNLGVVIPSLPHCRLSSTFLPAALPVYFCQDEDKDARRNVRWEEMEKEAIVTAAAAAIHPARCSITDGSGANELSLCPPPSDVRRPVRQKSSHKRCVRLNEGEGEGERRWKEGGRQGRRRVTRAEVSCRRYRSE